MAAQVIVNGPNRSVTINPTPNEVEIGAHGSEVTVPAVGPVVGAICDDQPVSVQPFKGGKGDKGDKGDQGSPGLSGESIEFARVAAANLSGHRAVTPVDATYVVYADPASIGNAPVWLTLQAALTDDPINLVAYGEVTEPAWNWVPGNVYLAANGVLTQIAPTSGALVVVGEATSPTTLFVDRQATLAL